MLVLTIPPTESWDEETGYFTETKETKLKLEHSLLSVSKWEAKWHKSYFHPKPKTTAEFLDYIRCMTINNDVDPIVYSALTKEHIRKITDYINDPMTATTFSKEHQGKKNRHIVTSEELYYSMASYQIPFECERWHLNRLLTLLRVAGIRNAPPKKRRKSDTMKRWSEINNQRINQ